MATKRNHELKNLTNYILKENRLRKTFVKFWANAQEYKKTKLCRNSNHEVFKTLLVS